MFNKHRGLNRWYIRLFLNLLISATLFIKLHETYILWVSLKFKKKIKQYFLMSFKVIIILEYAVQTTHRTLPRFWYAHRVLVPLYSWQSLTCLSESNWLLVLIVYAQDPVVKVHHGTGSVRVFGITKNSCLFPFF